MTNSDAQSKTESSESFSKKDAEMLPFGSKSALDTILGLAKKIGGQTQGEASEWAKEIERLAWQLIESYEKQSHRLEPWARGIGPLPFRTTNTCDNPLPACDPPKVG